MSPSNARRRQLQKLAERRAAERRRRRRQKALVIVTALVVAAAGGTLLFFALTGGDETDPSAGPTPAPTPSAETVACGGTRPAAADVPKETYDAPPEMTIDPAKRYEAVMETSCGTIRLELDAENAPNTVNSIVFLAEEGFFDGLTFHRIVKDFVIQGGDPTGDGTGGPGYQTVDEPPEGVEYRRGDLAMAKTQTDPSGAAGSQFFIVTGDPTALTQAGTYALIGRVIEGLDVAKRIEQLPAVGDAPDGPPAETVYIESVRIVVS